MGNDPKDSVLNKWNQMHEVSNVFVDGSACHLLFVKTPLTFMALTARAADYAVKELKKGNI
jgi:choline dehydrogenase-like flavoprotein